jgi:hypothetical protein
MTLHALSFGPTFGAHHRDFIAPARSKTEFVWSNGKLPAR